MEHHQSPSLSIKSQGSSPATTATAAGHGGKQQAAELPEPTKLLAAEPETPSLTQKVLAELVGTYVLVFAGCGSIMANESSQGQLGVVGIALTWGIGLMTMIYTIGHISGAHINPAVTLAFATSSKFPWREVPWYIVAQSFAATMAELTLKIIFHSRRILNETVNRPANGDYLQAFVFEFIMTAILMFVISGVATDARAVGSMAGIAIGATLAMNILYAGAVSGASMNPARSLGCAVVGNSYKELYVYIFAPSLGALLGSFIYNNILIVESSTVNNQEKSLKHTLGKVLARIRSNRHVN